jgi:uncharacterized protein (TIGR00303 family)
VTELAGRWQQVRPLLLLAATATAEVHGISAAGATAASRRQTAAADAELLLLGPQAPRSQALPPLPAGVSPALISHVGLRELGLLPRTLVVDLGCPVAPRVPHVRLPTPEAGGTAACVSTGAAMPMARVRALVERGRRWGRSWPAGDPLLLAECVPGGTTTALGVLEGLGIAATGLVSGSLRRPVHGLKATLVNRGLAAAGLGPTPDPGKEAHRDPIRVLAAVGDPMQALAAGLVLELAGRGAPVLLAGGSQMAAVLALTLALAPAERRSTIAAAALVATTAWVAREPGSDLSLLLLRIGARLGVRARLAVTGLRFDRCHHRALRDYECGYVKEGVGAGGVAVLWELSGRPALALAQACDEACSLLA